MMLKKYISREEIEKNIKRLAAEIENDYRDKEIIFICLLKGAFMFTADLIRHINNPVKVDFIRASSYGNGMVTCGQVIITKDLEVDITGKDIIIIEDIVDSGFTLKYIKDMLLKRNPKSLKICTLLDKKARRQVDIDVDYVGCEIEDFFIVGYGIDYAENYRNLSDIYIVKED
ncbi:MAG TPA: hypoxanthine phosphoribosyltransferase [Syntrophorhabdaceae bacterium]|nr:hypoxanthine phosphoribosyltransferase [Syntrophorhabdaceae bacterium]HPU28710.1 hypoxanthine phosphoribosyltransferase [Syntrophorhabdaceae bacterium]